ncbi:MAG: ELM1/GtrOC1 family putative glycosyltransferase [Candidatus Omnitrophota bacterium]
MNDYLSYLILSIAGRLIRILPLCFSLFLGRMIGGLVYYFDLRHKLLVYANIKTALGNKISPGQVSAIARKFYENFGQNLIEFFRLPLMNKEYFDKYIEIEGRNHITGAFKRGKGVILVSVHAGNWELSNLVCANLGIPFSLFVRNQRFERVNKLLNSYRRQKGFKLIQRQNQLRGLIQVLKDNQAVGMTVDQGGKYGELVDFCGKSASMSTGAVKIALKYDLTILPAFYTRVHGPRQKVIFQAPFELKKTGDKNDDIKENLQRLVAIFEKLILSYPQEYLWSYKIWKYYRQKEVLILSDGKAGHLRQAQAAAGIVRDYFAEKGINTRIEILNVEFKDRFFKAVFAFSGCLSGKYRCQGCLWCLKKSLRQNTYKSLISVKPDVVVSCGSSLSAVNSIISRENLAKSIVLMRPSILSTRKFDLVIMPKHDSPPKRKNVVVTSGALNLVEDKYLEKQTQLLLDTCDLGLRTYGCYIGLLVGGDTKEFHLQPDVLSGVIAQVKCSCEKFNAGVLVTTSRRTSGRIEGLLKEEFKDYPRCEFMVIANEKNLPFAIGGILGLSQIVIVSPESISMVSEAAASKKYVVVFNADGLGRKHRRFLKNFAENKYIYLIEPEELGQTIRHIWLDKPNVNSPEDNFLVKQAIRKIL